MPTSDLQIKLEDMHHSIIEWSKTITTANGYLTDLGNDVLLDQMSVNPPTNQRIIIRFSDDDDDELQFLPESNRYGSLAVFTTFGFVLQQPFSIEDKFSMSNLDLQLQKKLARMNMVRDLVLTGFGNKFNYFQTALLSDSNITYKPSDYFRVLATNTSNASDSEQDYISAVVNCQVIFYWNISTGNICSGMV